MIKLTKKQIIIFIVSSIILLGIGFVSGFYTKIIIDENQLIKEKEKQTKLSYNLNCFTPDSVNTMITSFKKRFTKK